MSRAALEKVNSVVFPGARLRGSVTIVVKRFKSENRLRMMVGKLNKLMNFKDMNWQSLKFPNKDQYLLYVRCMPGKQPYQILMSEKFVDISELPEGKMMAYAE